ncbi:hypothetical protein DFH11DRAFT_1761110 [Phellopilus nigrolimitatus]|nr:hypothetical protein DFH11DRAFT_1761110 [Phellopilus nigrolimitatus]
MPMAPQQYVPACGGRGEMHAPAAAQAPLESNTSIRTQKPRSSIRTLADYTLGKTLGANSIGNVKLAYRKFSDRFGGRHHKRRDEWHRADSGGSGEASVEGCIEGYSHDAGGVLSIPLHHRVPLYPRRRDWTWSLRTLSILHGLLRRRGLDAEALVPLHHLLELTRTVTHRNTSRRDDGGTSTAYSSNNNNTGSHRRNSNSSNPRRHRHPYPRGTGGPYVVLEFNKNGCLVDALERDEEGGDGVLKAAALPAVASLRRSGALDPRGRGLWDRFRKKMKSIERRGTLDSVSASQQAQVIAHHSSHSALAHSQSNPYSRILWVRASMCWLATPQAGDPLLGARTRPGEPNGLEPLGHRFPSICVRLCNNEREAASFGIHSFQSGPGVFLSRHKNEREWTSKPGRAQAPADTAPYQRYHTFTREQYANAVTGGGSRGPNMNKDLLDSDGDGDVEEEEALLDSEDEAEAEGDGEAKDDLDIDTENERAAFWRNRLLNIMNLAAVVIIFGTVIYLQGFRLEIPVKSNHFRGQRGSYPVKLFYTSNMPIMLESALTSNVFIVSQMLASRFPDNLLVRILGLWEPLEDSPQLAATGGIVYCLSPPHMLRAALLDPIHSKIYITFIISVCALFSKIGVRCPARVRATIRSSSKNQQMVMAGHWEGSMYKELKRVILTAAAFGDAIVGASSPPPPTSWALLAAALAYSWPSPSSSVTGKSAFVSQIARDGRVR